MLTSLAAKKKKSTALHSKFYSLPAIFTPYNALQRVNQLIYFIELNIAKPSIKDLV